MTTVAFSTMLKWYEPEQDITEKSCIDCGAYFTVHSRLDWHSKRCPSCSHAYKLEQSREYNRKKVGEFCTLIITVDLAYAVISKAVEDAKNGDNQAREFLRAEDGAEMYLKYAGIEVDDEIRKKLYWVGKKEGEYDAR